MATIVVVTINDRSPVFGQDVYYGSVHENRPAGTTTGVIVSATDPDVPSNLITYSISGHSNEFTINTTSGEITILHSLDAELLPSYVILTIVAEDSDGLTVTSSSVTANISVVDLNDNSPVFNQTHYVAKTPENTTVNSDLLQVLAVDEDRSGFVVTYSITDQLGFSSGQSLLPNVVGSGLGDLPFAINSQSGIITLSQSVDHEFIRQYNFTVIATDSGAPPTSTSVPVTIDVTDINDNKPMFIGTPYTTTISELSTIGQSVLTAVAVDRDSGSNADITYGILDTTLFAINVSTGVITVAGELDYEAFHNVTFTVQATDNGPMKLLSTAAVTIFLFNENDNSPYFLENLYTFNVTENTQFDFTITAVDPDSDPIIYSIASYCVSNALEIDIFTGQVSSIKTLDRETTPTCTLVLTASDSTHSANTSVLINVEDLNDNPPAFISPSYNITISEIYPVNATVLTVEATDVDIGTNGVITYRITGGNVNNSFAISSQGGAITVAAPLDFETLFWYNLTVIATDGGDPRQTGTALVYVTLTDHNDVSPLLVIQNNEVTYTEQSGIVHVAGDIRVIDPDTNLLQEATVVLTLQSCQPQQVSNVMCSVDLKCFELCGSEGLVMDKALLEVFNVSYSIDDDGLQLFINITGQATAGYYQSLLSTVGYVNHVDEPSKGFRVIEISVNDGEHYSNSIAINVTMSHVDDHCPTIYGNTSITFTEDMSEINIGKDLLLTVSDADSPPHQILSQLTITLTGIRDGMYDNLTVNPDATPLSVSHSTTPTSHVIAINGEAPIETYTDLLRTLSYVNELQEPTQGVRMITILPAQNQLSCTPLVIQLTVTSINDNRPIITLANTSTIHYEEESGLLPFAARAGLIITDLDQFFPLHLASITLKGIQDGSHESLVFNSSLPAGVSVIANSTSVTIIGMSSISNYQSLIRSIYYRNTATEPTAGTRNITVSISDGIHNDVEIIIVIVILNNDNALQLTASIVRFSFYEGNTTLPITGIVLSDTDVDSIVYSVNVTLVGSAVDSKREFISVQAFGSTSTSQSIVLTTPAAPSEYQVRERKRE